MVLDAMVLGIRTYPIAPRTILDISTPTILATFRKNNSQWNPSCPAVMVVRNTIGDQDVEP
jgi:hypothetical protein